MTETVAAGQLRAFIERIERIEADIKELNADKSDVYKELRGVGFDVKAVRQCVAKRKLDDADREERDAIFDLYWNALTGASRVHVHEGDVQYVNRGDLRYEAFPPHDAETGEIHETQESETGVAVGRSELAARSADESAAPHSSHETPSHVAAIAGETALAARLALAKSKAKRAA